MTTLNKSGYQQLIDGDIEWLKNQPRTLERDHIELVLNHSIGALYPPAPSRPDAVDGVFVPQSALDWLFGKAPDANGNWFTDICPSGPSLKQRYWWRGHFRKLIAATPQKESAK